MQPHRAGGPRGPCWAPTPTHPRPQHIGGGPQQPAQWAGSRGRDGAWPQTPPTMVEGTPHADALLPPPQRATPAREGARCGAGAGSPRPHRPHPGHTGRGTLAARSRGRAAGGGTAPDTKRPSQRWQATPPGDGPPPPPRHAAPTGHAGQGDSAGPPHPHTHAHSTWVADPNSPPSGRAVGGGTAPDLRRPSQWWKAPPPGTPFRHPHSEQRRPARAHAVGPVPGPRARTDRTRDTRVAKPWMPAPEDGRPGEGQRLTLGAPHNGGRPPPPGTAPHHPRGTQPPQGMQAKGTVLGPHTHAPAPTARGWRTPTARPIGGRSGEGQRLTSDAPHNGGRHPPRGRPSATPTASNTGPQERTLWGRCWVLSSRPRRPHPGHTGRGTLAARSRGRTAGGGTAPDTRRPSQQQQATPPGGGPSPPPRHAASTGHAGQGDSVGPPHPHTRAHSTWVADPNSPPQWAGSRGRDSAWPQTPLTMVEGTPPGNALPPPPQRATPARKGARCGTGARSPRPHRPHPGHTGRGALAARSGGRAAGGGTASDARRPSQWWKAPPPGTPFRHPHSEQRRPARAHVVGPVLGPHARTDRTRDTRVAEPWPPAPEDGRPGEGQRLTPGAPRNGDRPPPRGQPPTTPAACSPHRACRPGGQWRTPTARPIGGQSGEGQRLTPDAPHTMMEGTPPGDAPPPPLQRATHQRTHAPASHGTSAPHPLLLGTATQQWRNPRPYAKHAPDLRRWTRHTRSSGHWDSETATETPHKGTRTRTPTRRKSRGPPREARPRNLRRRRAACPPSAPRGNGATAPAKAGAPSSTLSPAPMTGRCPR